LHTITYFTLTSFSIGYLGQTPCFADFIQTQPTSLTYAISRLHEVMRQAVQRVTSRPLLSATELPLWIHPAAMVDDVVLQAAALQPDLAGCLVHLSNQSPSTLALKGAVHRVLIAAQTDCARRYPGFSLQVQPSHTRTVCQLLATLHTRQLRSGLLISSAVGLDVARLVANLSGAQLHVADQLLSSRAAALFKAKFVELLMQAGTKEEKVVLAVDVTQANAAVLSMLTSFVASGTVEDLLSPDNMVAVSTLTQPKVLAMGLSPTPHTVWTTFAEVARRHFQLALLLPRPGATCNTHLERIMITCPSLLSTLNVILWQDAAAEDLLAMAQATMEGVSTDALEIAQQTAGTASHLLAALHQSVRQSKPEQQNDITMLASVSTASFRRMATFAGTAINAGYAHIQARLARYHQGVTLTEEAERKLELLLHRHETLERVVAEKQAISTRVLTQMGRDVAAQRKAGTTITDGESLLEQLQTEALPLKTAYITSLEEATTFTDAMHELRDKLSDSVVQAVQKLVRPLPVVETLFAAVMLLLRDASAAALSDAELAWRTGGKRLCADPARFRSQLQAVELQQVPADRLAEVCELTGDAELHTLVQEAATTLGNGSAVEDEHLPLGLHVLAAWVEQAVLLHQQLNTHTRVKASAYNLVLERIVEVEADIAQALQRQASLVLRVTSLQENFETSTRLKNDHSKEFEEVKLELSQAEGMLDILSQERSAWGMAMQELSTARIHALGHGLLAAAVRTYLPGLSQPLRHVLLDAWLRVLQSFGVPVAGQQPAEASDESFDLNQLLPLMCSKRVMLGGVHSGDDSYMFVNRAALMAADRWCLLVDPSGFGRTHVAQATASLTATSSTINTLDLRFGTVPWNTLELQLEDLLASKRSVLMINAPFQPMEGMVAFLRTQAQYVLQPPATVLDSQGHLAETAQQQRVFISGSNLDVVAWQQSCEGLLAVVSYDDMSMETQQQYLGCQLLAQLRPTSMVQSATYLQEIDRLELALEETLSQLVDSFKQSQVQADVVEATVQRKQVLQLELERAMGQLHHMDEVRDAADHLAALPALLLRYAQSLSNLVGVELTQPAAMLAQFLDTLDTTKSIGGSANQACEACWQQLRRSVPAQRLQEVDVAFYLQVWVPLQRVLCNTELHKLQPEDHKSTAHATPASPGHASSIEDGTEPPASHADDEHAQAGETGLPSHQADGSISALGPSQVSSTPQSLQVSPSPSPLVWLPLPSQINFLLDPPCPLDDTSEPSPVAWISHKAVSCYTAKQAVYCELVVG
jgi:hypothetical protein